MLRMAVVPINHQQADTMTAGDTVPQRMEQTDTITTIHEDKPLPDIRRNNDTHIADLLPEQPTEVKSKQHKWSLDLAYTGGMGDRQDSRPSVFAGMIKTDITSEEPTQLIPAIFDSWSDYADYLSKYPGEGDRRKHNILLDIARNNADQPGDGKIERKSHHYMPITFSLALKYQMNNRFGLETGLSYSRLKSEFEMGSNGNTINEQQTIHYLGIPLKGTYNIYNGKLWNLYGNFGVTMDIPVYAPLSTSYFVNGRMELNEESTLHAPWQWSVGTGLGLQYNLTPNVGLFAEPSLQYYIPTSGGIETYRTEHPFTFLLPLGIRITW